MCWTERRIEREGTVLLGKANAFSFLHVQFSMKTKGRDLAWKNPSVSHSFIGLVINFLLWNTF